MKSTRKHSLLKIYLIIQKSKWMADHFCLLCYPTGRFPREVNYLWLVMVAKCFPFGCSIKNNIIISLNLVIPSIYLKLLFFGDHSSWQDKNPVIYFPTQEISRKKKIHWSKIVILFLKSQKKKVWNLLFTNQTAIDRATTKSLWPFYSLLLSDAIKPSHVTHHPH